MAEDTKFRAEKEEVVESKASALEMLKNSVSEEDSKPTAQLSLKMILGGDILNAQFVRRQLWLIVIVVVFVIIYVASRYQCQQDMIKIANMELELKDAKYRALSISSKLTERSRESHVLKLLKENNDSLLKASDQPPYIINVPKK
ncbi:MAG: FtsL-like putative cell division protein [Prevotella sp.]|nr:FtsL-like putative cell division protein [Prevotella sp.]